MRKKPVSTTGMNSEAIASASSARDAAENSEEKLPERLERSLGRRWSSGWWRRSS